MSPRHSEERAAGPPAPPARSSDAARGLPGTQHPCFAVLLGAGSLAAGILLARDLPAAFSSEVVVSAYEALGFGANRSPT